VDKRLGVPDLDISGLTPRPASSLSTLRDHGHPCTSYGHARLAFGI